ncbi:MAG: DUF1559 domain-containing protein [Mariniblastus sp.]|nr:DUF1559 domain-containing protein [Mariniblastus sp.]
MLLPAVQQVREAARRTNCSGNLKQIGIAMLNYEGSLEYFPDGGKDWWSARSMQGGKPRMAPDQNWGWLYQSLPFLEQGNLYYQASDAIVRKTPVATYFCPSRRPPTVLAGTRAMNDYAGNGGLIGEGGGLAGWNEGKLGGMLVRGGYEAPVTFQTVTDGTSNTFLVGEKAVHPDHYSIYSTSDNEGYTSGWDWDIIRWGDQTPIPDRQALSAEVRFGSAHPQGLNFVFVDGSVHYVTTNVDLQIFQNACQRDDNATTNIHD